VKIILFLAVFLAATISHSQTNVYSKKFGKLEFVKLDHGIAQVVTAATEKMENSPTGDRGWLNNFVIAEVTDSIPAILKTSFGVVYTMKSDTKMDIDVDIEWVYPKKITNEKNQSFKSIRYTTNRPTNEITASSYSLDEDYELVTGKWTMNIYIGKKEVYTKSFIVY